MNSIDRKYIYGGIIFAMILISLEISAYSLLSNDLSSTIFYDDRKLTANLEFMSSSSDEPNFQKMKINVFDETNKKNVENTVFFMTISNNEQDLLRNYFFLKDEDLLINIYTKDDSAVQISGEQQYVFDAFTMSKTRAIQIEGPIFIPEKEYTIKIKLRTVDDVEKIVTGIDTFEFEVNSDNINSNKDKVISQQVNFLEFEANRAAHLNNLGFRGPDIDYLKPTNMKRIFLVGGSTMYGAGATSDETTIPGYLQQILNKELTDYNFEVINAGIQGINSNTEREIVMDDIMQLNPDFVIIFNGWNDLQDNHDSKIISQNWNDVCKIGIKNNFDVIISLQPIAGFGEKILTKKELRQSLEAEDKSGVKLLTKILEYDDYTSELLKIDKKCMTKNLRGVFDDIEKEVYWDEGHLNDFGNYLIAKKFYELYNLDFISNISKDGTQLMSENSFAIDFNIPLSFQEIVSYYKTPVLLNEIFN